MKPRSPGAASLIAEARGVLIGRSPLRGAYTVHSTIKPGALVRLRGRVQGREHLRSRHLGPGWFHRCPRDKSMAGRVICHGNFYRGNDW